MTTTTEFPTIPYALQRELVTLLNDVATLRRPASLTVHTHGTYDRVLTLWDGGDLTVEVRSIDGEFAVVSHAFFGTMVIDADARWIRSYAERAWVRVVGCPVCNG